MNFDFEKTMEKASDTELIRIVTNPDQYQHEAIIAAQKELSKRNIPHEQFLTIKGSVGKENDIQAYKANTPLEIHWKVLAFLFPGFVQLILASSFKAEGYERKANEVARWTFYGLGFYIAIAIFSALAG